MYVVTENTPGYLPNDDEPAVFETLAGARSYARELVEQLRDYHAELDEACTVCVDSRTAPRSWYVVSHREHDLGRVIEISTISKEGGQ
jgi:hypothetical protein